MSANSPLTPDAQKKADSRRKRKAILAGGVVLGLGAAVTLAAWSDDVFADGVFTSGQFNIQGNASTLDALPTDGWEDYNTSDGAAPLSFSTGFNAMVPGTTVYSPISLRIDPDKAANSATVTLADASSTGDPNLMALLTYEAKTGIDPAVCAAGTTFTSSGTSLVPAGTTVDAGSSTSFTLDKTVTDDATTPVTVCIAVTLPEQPVGTPSNATAWTFANPVTTTWKFTGESA